MPWTKHAGHLLLVRCFFIVAMCSIFQRRENSGNHSGLVVVKAQQRWKSFTSQTKPEKCWVFMHMNKAAGSTIKTLLLRYSESEGIPHGLVSENMYARGGSAMENFLGRNVTVTAGGYTEGLRPFGGGIEDCKWFTMFRHPIARLVSAYFYCMGKHDQLCGSQIMRAEDIDLRTFAKHWGNYGLRQFVISFLDQDEVLGVEVAPEECQMKCPSWYKVERFLQRSFEQSGGGSARGESGETKTEPSLAGFLEPVKALLDSSYTAVGVLEEWGDSMSLYDRALQLPNFNWTLEGSRMSAKKLNVDQVKIDTLAAAWNDPELENMLRLDILLYEHAVNIHRAQLYEYGLV